jgi:hypothetical protein
MQKGLLWDLDDACSSPVPPEGTRVQAKRLDGEKDQGAFGYFALSLFLQLTTPGRGLGR